MVVATDEWARSNELWARSRRSLAGGVSTGLRASMKPHPLFFDRAQGAYMWDVDGHQLLDYVLGWGAVILGHCDRRVVEAVERQLHRGVLFGAQHVLEAEVAEQVLGLYPFAERLVYSNTGTEAVLVALRMARAFTGGQKVLKFAGHYHGWSDSVLVSYRPPAGSDGSALGSAGQDSHMKETVIVARWNDKDSVEEAFERHGQDIAAVIAEPVLANSGVIEPVPGYLEFLTTVTANHGALLIFDEIITGFRLGRGGASGLYGVEPDLVTLGKAAANGLPLSIVAGKAEVIDQVVSGGVVHAGTFNGNPTVLAAAKATISSLDGGGVYEHLEKVSYQLAEGLRGVLASHGVPAVVNQVCGIVQLLPGLTGPARDYADYAKGDWAWYDRLSVELLRRDVFVLPGGRIYLSVAHDEGHVDSTLRAFDDAVSACQRSWNGAQAHTRR
jgi:glutamate-1-semialdehyde 2,1-aminomutase